ncbi:hypothetical protein J6590_101779 [Homalodisca vitripennis]|nr:hypothetical protein J6590_101779 [Homalodisca vitripennis]
MITVVLAIHPYGKWLLPPTSPILNVFSLQEQHKDTAHRSRKSDTTCDITVTMTRYTSVTGTAFGGKLRTFQAVDVKRKTKQNTILQSVLVRSFKSVVSDRGTEYACEWVFIQMIADRYRSQYFQKLDFFEDNVLKTIVWGTGLVVYQAIVVE